MHANHKAITAARLKLGTTLNWLLEPLCFLCEENGEWRHGLCKHCWQHLPHNFSCCRNCALPLAREGLCGACQVTSMAFDQIIAPTVYRHPIDQMLCSLKYAGRLRWARTAAGLIVDCVLQQNLDLPQLLLPVPMTRKAIRRRGFNQSAYIARLVGRPTASPRSHAASANRTLPASLPLPDPWPEHGLQSLTMWSPAAVRLLSWLGYSKQPKQAR